MERRYHGEEVSRRGGIEERRYHGVNDQSWDLLYFMGTDRAAECLLPSVCSLQAPLLSYPLLSVPSPLLSSPLLSSPPLPLCPALRSAYQP